jgi:hypothetical protein
MLTSPIKRAKTEKRKHKTKTRHLININSDIRHKTQTKTNENIEEKKRGVVNG